MAEVINLNMFGGETPQVSTMPTPSAELVGKILQYAGATDGNFTAGYFYKCVIANGIPLWQRMNVQPSNAGISWGGVDGNITNQTDLANALNGKAGKATVTFVVDTPGQLATKTAATGDTAIVKTTGKLHTYGSEAWDGGVNGEYGVIYLGEAEQYMWDTTKFVLVSTEDAKTLNGKSESYFAKENEVAKKNGRYPLMNVGSADNLTGGFKVSREFSEDTAGGSADIADGVVKVERVKGNSVVFNQLIIDGNFTDTSKWNPYSGTTFSVANNIGTIQSPAANSYKGLRTKSYSAINNHKYFIRFSVKSADGNIGSFVCRFFGITHSNQTYDTTWKDFLFIDNYTGETIVSNNGYIAKPSSNVDWAINIKNLIVIDFTQMFGAGNEPATVEEFEQLFPLDYYDYNEGEILNLNPTFIKTVGFNAYNYATGKAYVIGGNQYQITGTYTSITEDGVTITPDINGKFTPTKNGELVIAGGDSTTTCVHLVWSGKRDGEYEEHWEETRNIPVAQINTDGTITESATGKTRLFPDGLCSVGSVYDEVTPVKAIKKIRKVDLGTLNWQYRSSHVSPFYEASIDSPDFKTRNFNLISTYSINDSAVGLNNFGASDEYPHDRLYPRVNQHSLMIKIDDIRALDGIYLYYELATPIEVTFAELLNLNYHVSDFGTETLLPTNGATPVTTAIKMDVEYGLNVVDTVRNLSRNYLGMTGTQNTFAVIASALAAYGISMTLGDYDETNKYYPVTISSGWKPASAAPASATAAGSKGEYYIDAEYFYVCVDDATWKRFALSSW